MFLTFFGPGEGKSLRPFIVVVWSQVCSKIGVVGKSAPVLLFPTSDIFFEIFFYIIQFHEISLTSSVTHFLSHTACACCAMCAIYPATLWPNMVKLCPETSVRSFFGTNEPLGKKVFNWSEVHLYWSNFLENPYFRP